MSGVIREIKISNLVNYYENPRHAIGSNEADTLKKLFNAVGIQYMLNLATDIQENGLLGNQQVVVVYFDTIQKYVVYEGNRRVAAIKLLLNPNHFDFLDKATIEKAKKIKRRGNISDVINCYVTDEQEAFFIMERLHSGENKGRGIKQWTPREKEIFKVRQNHEKNLSYLVDFYVKRYFDGFDITTILPFTTIQRIFSNHEIRKQIGLDVSNESTFTSTRMKLVIDASKWVIKEAESSGIAVTRLFNKARTIEDKLLPWIQKYMQEKNMDDMQPPKQHNLESISEQSNNIDDNNTLKTNSSTITSINSNVTDNSKSLEHSTSTENPNNNTAIIGSGANAKLPYFFQGLNCSKLDPHDVDTHGVTAVCRELQLFSDKKLVATYPISATFLTRSIIEQSIIYYSKKHTIQGQQKPIWENIENISNLSGKIKNYKNHLPNYITDATMRQYFNTLFGDYEKELDPLNWVVHRPAEFQLDTNTLIELPRKGLLALINYMLL